VDNARLYRDAQEGIRVRDEFLSTAAHELKTPVAIIKGYAQLLRRRSPADLAPRDRRALDTLDAECDRINRLVQDFLDVSRAEEGHFELRRERHDLADVVAAAVEQMQATTTVHQLSLLERRRAVVEIDKGRIVQVLVNLLGNAIKYSPLGGEIGVRLTARLGANGAPEVVCSVRDSGIGIPPDKQGRVFERFYRAHAGTAHEYGGMGIGLHLSQSIVLLHGGRMWFESEEGRGSTFSFSLPLAERDERV
jgi:two-component system, OmpR family, phosphate regulon sensor histidine kinase PhoR